uniref:WecB/TagA/CpsF family glycosyltransferase n=1 Tax=Oceaniglobus roseus TaxID=1737570 RepID=UPI000C7EF745
MEIVEFAFGRRRIRITVPSRNGLLETLRDRLSAGEGFALATINLDHIVKLHRDPLFLDAYAAHDLVVADGRPVVWLSRLAGRPVQLAPGSDLVLPMARIAAAAGRPVALVGSTGESLEKAAAALLRAVPDIDIALRIAPSNMFDPDGAEAAAILERLRAGGIGLCLLALGAPKQERLAARGRREAPGVGFASVGAGLDFLSGRQRRAPRLV